MRCRPWSSVLGQAPANHLFESSTLLTVQAQTPCVHLCQRLLLEQTQVIRVRFALIMRMGAVRVGRRAAFGTMRPPSLRQCCTPMTP